MCRLIITAIFLSLSWTALTHAQSSDQALNDFRADILKTPLILRGFSDDQVTTFQWSGTDLSFSDPKIHTIGMITAESIKLKGNKLTIFAKRQTLVKGKDGSFWLGGGSPATIVVELPPTNPALTLHALKSELFFATPQAAFAELPSEWVSIVKNTPKPKDPNDPKPSIKNEDCQLEGRKFSRPGVLKMGKAEFSEEARHAHFSGNVEVGLAVGEDGLPSDIWLVRPAGYGLDDKAIEAVTKYKFRPAMCDSKPVKTTLFIDVNFSVL